MAYKPSALSEETRSTPPTKDLERRSDDAKGRQMPTTQDDLETLMANFVLEIADSVDFTDTAVYMMESESTRMQDNWLVSVTLEVWLAHRGDIDLRPFFKDFEVNFGPDRPPQGILTSYNFRRTAQFVSDCTRVRLLHSIVHKALIGTDDKKPTSDGAPAPQRRTPRLPPEIVDCIVGILTTSWLKIPYSFSSAAELRRVWASGSVSLDEVCVKGEFAPCSNARRIAAAWGKSAAGGAPGSLKLVWVPRGAGGDRDGQSGGWGGRWRCPCPQGAEGKLRWDEKERQWICGAQPWPSSCWRHSEDNGRRSRVGFDDDEFGLAGLRQVVSHFPIPW